MLLDDIWTSKFAFHCRKRKTKGENNQIVHTSKFGMVPDFSLFYFYLFTFLASNKSHALRNYFVLFPVYC